MRSLPSRCALLAAAALAVGGCAGVTSAPPAQIDPAGAATPADPHDAGLEPVTIREFLLSPGDELRVSVYHHDELTRTITIPPDSTIFYPIVGSIDTRGMGIQQLRDRIVEGLSRYEDQGLAPGDEVYFGVFRHDEFSRQFVVPPDGKIFVPHVGMIEIEGKSISELNRLVTAALVDYIADPQVIIDIVRMNNPARIVNPQVDIELTGLGGHKVFVLGEVSNPGIFLADGHLDVLGVLAMAGGLTPDGKAKNVVLLRGGVNAPDSEIFVIDLKAFLETGDRRASLTLQKGDIIYVPRTTIAKVDRFFEHLTRIVQPIVQLEAAYWIGQNISVGPERSRSAVQVVP